jgi:hypothetical protein
MFVVSPLRARRTTNEERRIAEHSGVGADAEGQGQDGGNDEARTPPEHSTRVTEVSREIVDHAPSDC